MSKNHSGNLLNQITFEEHDGDLNARKVSLVSAATIYAVVNTADGGPGGGLATVNIRGNVTLSDSKGFIGLTTTVVGSALPAGENFIGLVTVVGSLSPAAGNVTLDDGSLVGIVDPADTVMKASIASVADGTYLKVGIRSNSTVILGNTPNVAVLGNVTLSDSKTYIGLTTSTIGNTINANVSLSNSISNIGFATVALSTPTIFAVVNTAAAGQASVVLDSSVANIGFATVKIGTNVNTNIGLVTIDGGRLNTITAITDITNPVAIKGNITLSDAKTYIGLTTTTLGASPAFVGIVTVANPSTFAGNVTLDDGSLVGLVDPADPVMKASIASVADGTYLKVGIRSNSTVLIGAALPAGTNAIGKLAANSGVDIGDVDVLSIAAGDNNIGNVDVVTVPALVAGEAYIGLATVKIGSNVNTNIGLVTVDGGRLNTITAVTDITNPIAIKGNVTLSDSKTYIGLTSTTLGASPAFIGIVTVANPSSFTGNVTLDDGSLTGIVDGADPVMKVSIASVADGTYLKVGIRSNSTVIVGNTPNVAVIGNVTLSDPKGFIGLVTVVGSLSAAAGNVTLDDGSLTGIVDGADPVMKASIASVADGTYLKVGIRSNSTILLGNALPAGTNNIGDVDVLSIVPGTTATSLGKEEDAGHTTGDTGVMMLGVFNGDASNLVSTEKDYSPIRVDQDGAVIVRVPDEIQASITNAITLAAGTAAIGKLVANSGVDIGDVDVTSIAAGANYIGLASVNIGGGNVGVLGNVTLSDAKTFIGLVTSVYAPPPISTYTSFCTIFSATGNASLFAPPAGKRFVIKDLHVSSLGRAEVNIKSSDNQLIPYTSLSTTSGFFEHYGEAGLAAQAADDIFALTLNGGATISIMVNVRFE